MHAINFTIDSKFSNSDSNHRFVATFLSGGSYVASKLRAEDLTRKEAGLTTSTLQNSKRKLQHLARINRELRRDRDRAW